MHLTLLMNDVEARKYKYRLQSREIIIRFHLANIFAAKAGGDMPYISANGEVYQTVT